MPVYEPGIYEDVEIVDQGLTTSAKKHTPEFFLIIRPGEHNRTMQWWITEGSVGGVVRDLRRLKFTSDKWSELDPQNPQHHSFVGERITVECTHEPRDGGGVYERWQLPREAPKMDETGKRSLDALFGRALKQATAVPAYSAPVESVDTSGNTDQDVPF